MTEKGLRTFHALGNIKDLEVTGHCQRHVPIASIKMAMRPTLPPTAAQFDLSLMAFTMAAILVGIVVAGSNHSTAKEATHELTAAEAKRTALIGQLELRLVPDRDVRQ